MTDDFKAGFVLGHWSTLALFVACAVYGCVSEADQRQHWQDCGGVYHEECVDSPDFRACEYEYYKECVNE